jgi:serine kinase of HPr protein (carbohydrate metabolism regulator)
MAIIAEVAALNHRLKEMGVDSEKILNERLTQVMTAGEKAPEDFDL